MLWVVENAVQAVGQQRQAHRLFESGDGFYFVKTMRIGARQDDDGNPRDPRIRALSSSESPSVHHRHAEVEHDDARPPAASQLRQGIEAVGRLDDVEALER